ncbi:MAG: RnfABCDGE type electron transport complex subunit G [Candidatus Omnitrophica bacterium]|nr:RnfABCDGE type electron transport complex subunit G [Candidatus Omnitrophota bacterium]
MRKGLKITLTLTLIAVLSGAILAEVYKVTIEDIKVNQKKEIEKAIFSVLPGTKEYKKEARGTRELFKCFDDKAELRGIAFVAEGIGYQDIIKVVVGVDSGLSKITGIRVIAHNETPGLGAKISEGWFEEQFKGLSAAIKLDLVKGKPDKENQIQAITGATISSQALVDIINKEVKDIKKYEAGNCD